MPRGYLKNQGTRVCLKKARGGSSRNALIGGQKKRGSHNYKHRRFSRSIGLEDIHEHIVHGRYNHHDNFGFSNCGYTEDIDERYYRDDLASDLQIAQSPCHATTHACGADHTTTTDYMSEATKEYEIVKVDRTDGESVVSVRHSLLASFSGEDSYSLCSGVSQSLTDSFTFVDRVDGDGGEYVLSIDTTETKEKNDTVVIHAPAGSDVGSLMNESTENDRALHTAKFHENDTFKCTICLEDLPLDEELQLFRKCKHPTACRECLRTYYIKNGIQPISNFPLKCYWPGCGRRLGDIQARLLTTNEHELQTFYTHQSPKKKVRKEKEHSHWETKKEKNPSHREIAKKKRSQHMCAEKEKARRRQRQEDAMYEVLQRRRIRNFKTLQYCHACTATTPVHPSQGTTFKCHGCKWQYNIDVMTYGDVRALVQADVGSPGVRSLGDLLVNCPSCFTLIIKDGGCDLLVCSRCQTEFEFSVAKIPLDE